MAAQIINSERSHQMSTITKAMKKRILITILLALTTGAGFAFYLFNKPHQSIADVDPVFKLNAQSLIGEYDHDENLANAKYLGKVVEVNGVVSEKIKDNSGKCTITLQGADLAGVGCVFDPSAQSKISGMKEGERVSIKGICTGVLMDVVLVDCVISSKN